MTPRQVRSPDAITLVDAANRLGLPETRVTRLRREGLLIRLPCCPTYSRTDIEAFIDNPWLNGRQVAHILGITHGRVSQLASQEKIPVHHTASGQRVYRMQQLEVVARARNLKFHSRQLLQPQSST